MSFQEFLLITGIMVGLVTLRVGLPMLCTWGICCIARRVARHA